jgi:hypothetical protein
MECGRARLGRAWPVASKAWIAARQGKARRGKSKAGREQGMDHGSARKRAMNRRKNMKKQKSIKTKIVIADRGFVWVGKVTTTKAGLRIENARCIRRWGTTTGLGQLIDGPMPETVLDQVGTVEVPLRAVIGVILCNRDW